MSLTKIFNAPQINVLNSKVNEAYKMWLTLWTNNNDILFFFYRWVPSNKLRWLSKLVSFFLLQTILCSWNAFYCRKKEIIQNCSVSKPIAVKVFFIFDKFRKINCVKVMFIIFWFFLPRLGCYHWGIRPPLRRG